MKAKCPHETHDAKGRIWCELSVHEGSLTAQCDCMERDLCPRYLSHRAEIGDAKVARAAGLVEKWRGYMQPWEELGVTNLVGSMIADLEAALKGEDDD